MNRTARRLVAFIGGIPLSLLLGQAPNQSVEQALRSQYRVASVDGRGNVIRPGAVLVVAQDGIKSGPPSNICWYNSHKPGNRIKYSVLAESLVPPDVRSQMRLLQVGEKLVVMRLGVKASDVEFCVQTFVDNPNDVPYRACLLFQFQPKGFVQPANLKAIQDSIAEVFSLDTVSPGEGAVGALGQGTQSESQVATPGLEQVAGVYVMAQATDNRLQLNADGTLALVQGGRNYSGTFTLQGNKLIGRIGNGAPQQEGVVRGDTLIDPNGSTWVKQRAAPAAAVPTIAPLRLPSTYVSSQAPADQLQLNADNSFSLQEAGQPYRGTFAVNGNEVELNIADGPKTTVTIEGNSLKDSSGQTWVLRGQSAGTAPAGPMLKNEDIVKMAKAGLDDALIIAKIGTSKCQFDTSTDALIQLKGSGVSATLLKAMVGAGK